MTEITKTNGVKLFDPVAFFGALVLAPGLVGLLGLPLVVPPFATILGAPLWLGLGTPALLWMVGRYPPRFATYALFAVAGHIILCGGALLIALWRPDLIPRPESELIMVYLIFGAIFAPLWGGLFAKLYNKFNRMADLGPVHRPTPLKGAFPCLS